MLQQLRLKNPAMPIYPVEDTRFARYGQILTSYPLEGLLTAMQSKPIPPQGNVYVAADEDLMRDPAANAFRDELYGGMPIQVGYCNGNSRRLDALEYHKSAEVDIAVSDLVLLLGDVRDIVDGRYPSDRVEGFFLPAGTACELYATALHFAPCSVSSAGFKSIVILPENTNTALNRLPVSPQGEARLLWMRGKWLIAHPDSAQAAKGAWVGIAGGNPEIVCDG